MLYGKLKSEELAEQNQQCRRIVSEIMNFGVTQRQIWLLIHSLALELENIDEMRTIVGVVREMKGEELFLSMMGEDVQNG